MKQAHSPAENLIKAISWYLQKYCNLSSIHIYNNLNCNLNNLWSVPPTVCAKIRNQLNFFFLHPFVEIFLKSRQNIKFALFKLVQMEIGLAFDAFIVSNQLWCFICSFGSTGNRFYILAILHFTLENVLLSICCCLQHSICIYQNFPA